MNSSRSYLVAAGLATASLVVFPLADAITKSLSGAVPLLVLVWVRFMGSALLITPLILVTRSLKPPSKQALVFETLRACIIIVAFGSYVYSFQTIQFSEAATYYSFAPIMSAVLAIVFLKERINKVGIFALVMGMMGVLVALNPQVTPAPGAYFAIGTGVLFGCYLFLNRVVAVRGDPNMALFLQFWIGAALLMPFVWPLLTQTVLQHWIAFLAIAAVSVTCNVMLINAYRLARANFLAPFLYVEIPSALIMAAVFFGETLTWNIIVGAALILVAGILVLREISDPVDNAPSMRKES